MENRLIRADDVAQELNVSKSYAYKLIRKLNEELKAKGFITIAYRDEKKKPYSQTYLKTLHNQLSAIFNHAVRYYELRSNPAAKV